MRLGSPRLRAKGIRLDGSALGHPNRDYVFQVSVWCFTANSRCIKFVSEVDMAYRQGANHL